MVQQERFEQACTVCSAHGIEAVVIGARAVAVVEDAADSSESVQRTAAGGVVLTR